MFDVEDISSLVAQIKGLIGEICKEDGPAKPGWTESLDRAVTMCSSLPILQARSPEVDSHLAMLENSGISLWNFSVAIKTKGSVSVDANAKCRHMSFMILDLCGQLVDNATALKRQIMMGLKTARAWLDCNQHVMADTVLKKTEQCITRLQGVILGDMSSETEAGSDDKFTKQKLETEQDLFTLLCYRAESALSQDRSAEALDVFRLAKELLPKFPKETSFLAMLAYNFGVDLYQQQQYNEAVVWLRESFELGKDCKSIGAENQARTLRLLANAYIDADPDANLDNALNAISLANTEHRHPAGFFLKMKILVLQKEPDDVIKGAIEELLKLPELTVDLNLHVLQLINEHNRSSIVMWLIEELLKKFENSPDVGKLLITNLEVLLQGRMATEAKEFVEYCITGHQSGRPLDDSIQKRFHSVFWEQAALTVEAGQHQEAVDWYNYSLSLFTQTDTGDVNLAKLHRNRANCYLNLTQYDKAREAIVEAEKYEPDSTHAQYILYKLALAENDTDTATQALKKLCELAKVSSAINPDLDTTGMVALAAQQALDTDKVESASVALEYLTTSSGDTEQVLTALRCLIRLKLAAADKDGDNRFEAFLISGYIKTAYNKLLELQDSGASQTDKVQAEATWFMKIAWNLALQCEDQPGRMKELYTLCSQLLSLGPLDESAMMRQMTCIMMSAAACLEMARSSTDGAEKKLAWEESLEQIAACRQLFGRVHELSLGTSSSKTRDTELLLMFYEFEARIKLKDPSAETVLEKALTLPGTDPKTFETLAALAIEPPAHNRGLSVRAMKVAIRRHLQAVQPDIQKCSKLFHSLIQLCLSGSSSQDITSKEEAANYYAEILDVIEKHAQGQYPEMEVVWLMTKAWNCGINFYSVNKYSEAEKWCGLSVRMLQYLDTFKNSYEDHMNTIYADILAKMEGVNSQRKSLEI